MVIDMNLSTLRSMNAQNESANALQFTIDLIRADYSMLEAVINVDIAQVMNESGRMTIQESEMSALLESTGNGIIAKIKELIAKGKTALLKFYNMIKEKIQSIFDKDKRLIKKHEDEFNEVISKRIESESGEFEIPDYEKLDMIFDDKIIRYSYGKVIQEISKMKNSKDDSEIKTIIDNYDKDSKDYIESLNKLSDQITKKVQGKLPSILDSTARILGDIKSGKSERIKKIKAYTDTQIKSLDKLKSELNFGKVNSSASYRDNNEKRAKEITKYNACFSLINIAQQTVNKSMHVQLHALKKEYSVERKLFLQIVKLAPKKDEEKENNDKSVDEAFELWAIGERSDIAMEAAFMD